MEEYQSQLEDIPEAFRHIKTELPVLLLCRCPPTDASGDRCWISTRCAVQIEALDDVIAKALPAQGDSWARRGRKALGSLRYDAKAEKIATVVRGYIQTLTFHAAASLRPLAGMTLL